MEATDVVSTLACPSLSLAGSLLDRDVVLRRCWIDFECLVSLLAAADYLCPSSPPSPLSVSHTIGILLGTGAFWIILFFFIFALGSSFFLWPALVYFIFGTLLDYFSSCRASSLSLYRDIHHSTTNAPSNTPACCSCLVFFPRLPHRQTVSVQQHYHSNSLLLFVFLIFRHHRLPNDFPSRRVDTWTFTSCPPTSPFTRPSPPALSNGPCILRMPRHSYTLIF